MINDRERLRIRAARYMPRQGFQQMIEGVLSGLPEKRRRRARISRRAAGICAAVAALLLIGPIAVKAAQPIIDKLWNQMAQRIEQRMNMPLLERIERDARNEYDSLRSHPVSCATEFKGATISMDEVALYSSMSANDGDSGYFQAELQYDGIPAFDPNYIDFTLVVGRAEYPMTMEENMTEYRATGARATSAKDWRSAQFVLYNSVFSHIVDGTCTTYVQIPIGKWRYDEQTEMALRGELDGEVFELKFTFDQDAALKQAQENAREEMDQSDEINLSRRDFFLKMDESAIPLGITRTFKGRTVVLSELALLDGELCIGWYEESADSYAENSLWLRDVSTDGYKAHENNYAMVDESYGAVRLASVMGLGRDANKLPGESLVYLCMSDEYSDYLLPVAFRCNWAERRVTLPVDAAEEAAWIKEAERMALDMTQPWFDDRELKLAGDVARETGDGAATLKITGATLQGHRLIFAFELSCDGMWIDSNRYDKPEATLNGMRLIPLQHELDSDRQVEGYSFDLPVHPSEFEGGELELVYPLNLVDDMNRQVLSETLSYNFEISGK